MHSLVALVTLSSLALFFWMGADVARARIRFAVPAQPPPAIPNLNVTSGSTTPPKVSSFSFRPCGFCLDLRWTVEQRFG